MRDSEIPKRLERNLSVAEARAEFDAPSVAAWLKDLDRQGLGLALPALMLKLDALSKADLPPPQRVELLQLLKRPVLKALASLPKPVVAASAFVQSAARGVTLEQRLLLVAQDNFRRAMHALWGVKYIADDRYDHARSWVIRTLLDFTERQILYGIHWQVPWPPGTWQELHDLFVFLSGRGSAVVLVPMGFDSSESGLSGDRPLEPALAYKRLLLLGLASQLKPSCCEDPHLLEHLDKWAADSRLDDPDARVWDVGVYLVEVGKDCPPRYWPGVLEDSFHGWVLEPALGFLSFVGRGPATPGFHPA